MKTLLKDCQLVSPEMELEGASILIENDRIKRIYTCDDELPEADQVIDIQGDFVMPGFIDVHCHGNSGLDFADCTLEAVKTMAEKKLLEGVTTLLPTTLTLPEETLAEAMKTAAEYAKNPTGCKVPGVHLEGPFINPKCLGAQNPAYVRVPNLDEVMRLNAIYPVLKVSYAVEMEGGAEFAAELISEGITPSCVHSAATYAEFQAAHEHGLKNLSHFCNQMTPLHHRDIGLVGAGLINEDVYIEFICDKLHICPDMINLVFSLKDVNHIQLITDAMRAAGMPEGPSVLGGMADGQEVIVEDGVAKLLDRTAFAGSVATADRLVRTMVQVAGCSMADAVRMITENPARVMGISDRKGALKAGMDADVVIFDDNVNIKNTIINGKIVY